ncbi:HPP family protein [Trinickia caryophylli]|uniref:CBS domain-containing membrane protein n=1 Tax=Trinickia caryophylli TaxID=28094 RepID=A0A1X7DIU6_TRICW|nr:HPP family protein [Trinickia caryophylli]PMS12293.1 hypothetical protein C0Z17_10010 [Trinickia caryophylli]TRX17034.1 hypothetical protein FNF07_01505 [Trinickia caryophylli]WQE12228.1 HPP family protein [Trinickia caryophylli]SMF15977.1 CBS domain-containing membrane protein [Trinickia caryophylli]GLU31632.1 hypothetical protein Busp01_14740 [Trinickia caryophylli]
MSNGAATSGKRFRSCLGALFGIAFTSGVAHLALGASAEVPLLVAPMGASAVLLFAVPESPLAQPWSIMGGNLVAAIVGVTCAQLIGAPALAAATAVALAISLMLALRCVHPPSGAVALTAVLGGPAIHALGYRFAVIPIALQSAALLGAALMFHFVMGHRYPHPDHITRAEQSVRRWLGRMLDRRRNAGAFTGMGWADGTPPREGDVEGPMPGSLAAVFAADTGELTCADIMAPLARAARAETGECACTVGTGAPITQLAPHFRDHACDRVGVVDERGRVVGTISQLDLIWGLYRQIHVPQRLAV